MSTLELYSDFCSPTATDYTQGEKSVFRMSVRTAGILDGWDESGVKYFFDGHGFAGQAHEKQERFAGRPYITHPEGSLFILQNEILVPQGKTLTPSEGVQILNHDVLEDCPGFIGGLYGIVSPEDFAGIVSISKMNPQLSNFLLTHTQSRVGLILGTNYLAQLATGTRFILFKNSPFWQGFIQQHNYIDWGRFDVHSFEDWIKLVYTIAIVTNFAEYNTLKTADAVYNLRDSEYLSAATDEKRKSRKEKIGFFRQVLLSRLQDDANVVECNLLREAIEYAEDHMKHLETPTVTVPS